MKKRYVMSILVFMLCGCGPNSSTTNNANSSSSIKITNNISVKDVFKISYEENENCTIVLSKTAANKNEVIQVSVSNIKTGYELEKITANGMKINKDGTFIMPNEDVLIKVHLKYLGGEEVEPESYIIEIEKSEYAIISLEKEKYEVGEVVKINYTCKGTYILDSFYVNEKKIAATLFVMPKENVVIRGTFKNAIEDTPWQLSVDGGGLIAKSYWYFDYLDNGLSIKVIVNDRMLCGSEYNSDFGYQDNVEFILNKNTATTGWEKDKTLKVLVSCSGGYFFQRANSSTTWGNISATSSTFNSTVTLKSLENKDGYNGYEVNIFCAYSLFSITKEEALNNLAICLALRNTTTHNSTNWGFYAGETGTWENGSTHPLILENGSIQERG